MTERSDQNSAPVDGIRIGVTSAGIYRDVRDDVTVMVLDEGTSVAGAFTRNRAMAAPVIVAKEHLAAESPRALIINAGNANAGLGKAGKESCLAVCEALAKAIAVPLESVLPFSTGVIGAPLPVAKIVDSLPKAVGALSDDGWDKAASAIQTTDTFAKRATRKLVLSGDAVTITGIAKGSGMICPDMATMLAYVATDANLSPEMAQELVAKAVGMSFNRITVDGDTSTNDSCLLMATGASGVEISPTTDAGMREQFENALMEVFAELARMIVKDAEGATKFISIEVTGGWSEADCLRVGYVIAHSPLVKTAMFASDPNWGRIYAAIGRSHVEGIDMSLVSIAINDVEFFAAGAPSPDYTEEKGLEALSKAEIHVSVNLGMGDMSATVLTSDFSHEYVRINAEYRS